MNLAHLFEAGMLVCFGFSWPMNVVKAYKAGTAKSTSLTFIFLIITGYVLGISAKLINHQFNYVLAVYLLNLVIVLSNVLVYFRNKALDKKREMEATVMADNKKHKLVYAHEEMMLFDDTDKKAQKKYNITLLGGTYAKDIPVNKVSEIFDFDFNLYNKSTFALSLKNSRKYFEKYVSALNSDGIILQLGKEDRDLFKANPAQFDTLYLEVLDAIKAVNADCRIALVSINNILEDATVATMNNHIKAIAQAQQATYFDLTEAKLWKPKSIQSSLEFAENLGLNIKKPIYDIAQILYSYAAQNVAEENTVMDIAI